MKSLGKKTGQSLPKRETKKVEHYFLLSLFQLSLASIFVIKDLMHILSFQDLQLNNDVQNVVKSYVNKRGQSVPKRETEKVIYYFCYRCFGESGIHIF